MKRYEMFSKTRTGAFMSPTEDGRFVEHAEAASEIDRLKSVLKIVANTLPFIGGNPRSVDNLLREIKAVQ